MTRQGFTFLEIIVTLALLGVSFFSFLQAFNQGFFQTGNLEDQQIATALTESKLEELKDAPFANIASSNPARSAVSGYTKFEREVIVVATFPDLKQVTVNTYWSERGQETSYSLSTYIGS